MGDIFQQGVCMTSTYVEVTSYLHDSIICAVIVLFSKISQ